MLIILIIKFVYDISTSRELRKLFKKLNVIIKCKNYIILLFHKHFISYFDNVYEVLMLTCFINIINIIIIIYSKRTRKNK